MRQLQLKQDSILVQNSFNSIVLFQMISNEIYKKISNAKVYYPNFDIWYYDNVIPSVFSGDKELIFEMRYERIVGVAIIKHSEKKLCHLSIFDEYRDRGYGLTLFEKVFDKLDTRKPYLSVSEEKYIEFNKIFNYYGFQLSDKQVGVYRKDKVEYYFNEEPSEII